ncbi:predicted protein [Botrytis cinerea T4]|uniref:Uncharacterized protein n=1 Tax=Botryotinia fuckeliana (strain T4) TaxID=999810 RepID=G2XV28_BOTF4|nr:predicted protein [Botrytis cinerea T4]
MFCAKNVLEAAQQSSRKRFPKKTIILAAENLFAAGIAD